MPKSRETPDQAVPAFQVWIDAQLPPALARWLHSDYGVDAIHVEELGLLNARDPVIFATARATKRAVAVLTKDDDFVKLVGQQGPPPQVVWVRCGNVTNRELRHIIHGAWPRTASLLAAGEALIEVRRRQDAS